MTPLIGPRSRAYPRDLIWHALTLCAVVTSLGRLGRGTNPRTRRGGTHEPEDRS